MSDIELTMLPHACLSTQLANVTLQAVQKLLEQAYLNWRANPAYLFCNEQVCDELSIDAAKTTTIFGKPLHPDPNKSMVMPPTTHKLVGITNYTTGRLVSIITLPELTPGTFLFGFVDFSYPPPPSVDPRLIGRD